MYRPEGQYPLPIDRRKHEGPFCPSDALFVKPNQATSSRQIAFPPVAEPLGGGEDKWVKVRQVKDWDSPPEELQD